MNCMSSARLSALAIMGVNDGSVLSTILSWYAETSLSNGCLTTEKEKVDSKSSLIIKLKWIYFYHSPTNLRSLSLFSIGALNNFGTASWSCLLVFNNLSRGWYSEEMNKKFFSHDVVPTFLKSLEEFFLDETYLCISTKQKIVLWAIHELRHGNF